MNTAYDAIIVGARCAGSPTAMLLARKGYRVLVVDRATFPSDTVSSHVVHPLGAAALARWGLIDRLTATGCPPMHTYAFDFGPFTLSGSPGTEGRAGRVLRQADGTRQAARRRSGRGRRGDSRGLHGRGGPDRRRTHRRHQGSLKGWRDGDRAGQGSWWERMAAIRSWRKPSGPTSTNERPPLLAGYYTYWSGLPIDGRFETYIRAHRGFAVAPTHDGLTLTVGGWPYAEFETNKKDVEGHFLKMFDLAPEFAERVRGAKREAPFAGAPVTNFFRKPYGPGWALVGDAGYNKDPITAQGITDAFRDAELCAIALDQTFTGARSFDDAMGEYQRTRDQHVLPMYEFTCQLATLEPPPPEMQQLFGAIHGNQKAMDGFVQMNAGTISPAQFFSPENIGAIMAAARVTT